MSRTHPQTDISIRVETSGPVHVQYPRLSMRKVSHFEKYDRPNWKCACPHYRFPKSRARATRYSPPGVFVTADRGVTNAAQYLSGRMYRRTPPPPPSPSSFAGRSAGDRVEILRIDRHFQYAITLLEKDLNICYKINFEKYVFDLIIEDFFKHILIF